MIPPVVRPGSGTGEAGTVASMFNGRSSSTRGKQRNRKSSRGKQDEVFMGFTRVESNICRRQSSAANDAIDFSGLHANMPPEEDRVLDVMVEKMCAEDRYKMRRLIATQDLLLFSKNDPGMETYNTIVDSIPLHEIARVFLAENGEVLEMETVHGGFNSGRPYVLRMNTDLDNRAHETLRDELKTLVNKAMWREAAKVSPWLHRQHMVKMIYDSRPAQVVVALLIGANFIVNGVEKEYNPEPHTELRQRLDILESVFTFLFAGELLINAIAHWFREFIYDGWNQFDILVVVVSVTSVAVNFFDQNSEIPGLSVLRLLRAFRVMRLFGRLGAQRRIIAAIQQSMQPVFHALVIVALIIAIYAILAVDFFHERNVLFSNLSEATFTMFQIATFEGWEDVARSLFLENDAGVVEVDIGVFFFFGSYIALVSWTLLPVVVALLLDNFTQIAQMEKAKLEEEKRNSRRTIAHVLDPLLAKLSHYNTASDLSARIATLYHILDVDESGGLSYKELFEGLKKLNLTPGVHLSKEDYEIMTDGESLCNEMGELGPESFEQMIRMQLRLYTERNVEGAMRMQASTDGRAIYSSLKMIMLELDEVRRRVMAMESAQSSAFKTETPVEKSCSKDQSPEASLQQMHRKPSVCSSGGGSARILEIESAHSMIQNKSSYQENFAKSLMPTAARGKKGVLGGKSDQESSFQRGSSTSSTSKIQPRKPTAPLVPSKLQSSTSSGSWRGEGGDQGSTGLRPCRINPPLPTIGSPSESQDGNSPQLRLQTEGLDVLLPPALRSSLRRRRSSDAEVIAMASPAARSVEGLLELRWGRDSLRNSARGTAQILGGIRHGEGGREQTSAGRDVSGEEEDFEMGEVGVIKQSGAC